MSPHSASSDRYLDVEIHDLPKRNGKPIFEIQVKTVLNFESAFGHKLLCDSLTFSLGTACAATCAFCYVKALFERNPQVRQLKAKLRQLELKFEDVVIIRIDALNILREQLTLRRPRWVNLGEKKVVFTSPLVDPALSFQEISATAEACRTIFELTTWDVRILTKGSFLKLLVRQIPERFHQRLILGHSTGTLNDQVAAAMEKGTALVSKRIEDHRWLQDNGFRTFGMLCPSLPQTDPDAFVEQALEAIRPDRCEHVWGEVFNLRGKSLSNSCTKLEAGGFPQEAARLRAVSGGGHGSAWEAYARETFLAYTRRVSPEKLRFLQYVRPTTRDWWLERRPLGAVVLGKGAG